MCYNKRVKNKNPNKNNNLENIEKVLHTVSNGLQPDRLEIITENI